VHAPRAQGGFITGGQEGKSQTNRRAGAGAIKYGIQNWLLNSCSPAGKLLTSCPPL
jgi:hypothetical protein